MPKTRSGKTNYQSSRSNTGDEVATRAKGKRRTTVSSRSDSSDDECDDVCDLSSVLQMVQKQMKQQKERMKEMAKSFDFLSDNFDKITNEISKLTKENKQIKRDVSSLQKGEKKLEKRMQQFEKGAAKTKQNDNENHMIVTNLPKFSEDTNLTNVVIKIGEQVEHRITADDIVDVYQNENKERKAYPLVVKMKTNELKTKCMEFRKGKKAIDGNAIVENWRNQKENINFHHLIEKEYSELLKKAKEMGKSKKYKFIWYKNSTVFARKGDDTKIIAIRDEDDLKKIK